MYTFYFIITFGDDTSCEIKVRADNSRAAWVAAANKFLCSSLDVTRMELNASTK